MAGYMRLTSYGRTKVPALFPDGSVRSIQINERTGYASWNMVNNGKQIHVSGTYRQKGSTSFSFHPDLQKHVDWIMANPPKRVRSSSFLTDEAAIAATKASRKRYYEKNKSKILAKKRAARQKRQQLDAH